MEESNLYPDLRNDSNLDLENQSIDSSILLLTSSTNILYRIYLTEIRNEREKRFSHRRNNFIDPRYFHEKGWRRREREKNVFLFLRLRLRFYLQTFQGVLRFVVCRCRIEYIGNDISVNRKSRTGRGVNHASFEGMRGSATSFSARKG